MNDLFRNSALPEMHLKAWIEERQASARYYQPGNGSALLRFVAGAASRSQRGFARIERWARGPAERGIETGQLAGLRR
jgi:hypothetical protein